MTGVQNGGVEKTPQTVIKNAEVRNRSVSDRIEREKDLRELNDMYAECLWYMQEDNPYAEHIYDLQTYLEYCLGRKVNVIPEGWIPKKDTSTNLPMRNALRGSRSSYSPQDS